MFRDEGIIILYTSRTQTLMLDDTGECLATGIRGENAYWKVHKVKEGGIRMFENLSMPDSFLQVKNGACNAKVILFLRQGLLLLLIAIQSHLLLY